MTTLTHEPIHISPTPGSSNLREQCLVLEGIPWQSYLIIGQALADRPALRLTYDRGSLEFTTTSPKHEIYKKHLSRFIEIMAEELNKPFAAAGNMTFQKEELDKGLEADDCFWFEHEAAMRGKLTWDPKVDPSPDLGLEIEISRSALNRMAIYAALRIEEIWRFESQSLVVHRLQADGTYAQVLGSQIFPGVPLGELVAFLDLAQTTDLLNVIRAFRQWIRNIGSENAGPG